MPRLCAPNLIRRPCGLRHDTPTLVTRASSSYLSCLSRGSLITLPPAMLLPLQLVLRQTTCNYAWCHWRMPRTAAQRDGATAAAWQVQSSGRVRRAGTPGYARPESMVAGMQRQPMSGCADGPPGRLEARRRRPAALAKRLVAGRCMQPTARPTRLCEHAALRGPDARACSLLPGRPPERAATLCDRVGFGGISRRPPQGRIAGMRHQAEGESSQTIACCRAAQQPLTGLGRSRSRR